MASCWAARAGILSGVMPWACIAIRHCIIVAQSTGCPGCCLTDCCADAELAAPGGMVASRPRVFRGALLPGGRDGNAIAGGAEGSGDDNGGLGAGSVWQSESDATLAIFSFLETASGALPKSRLSCNCSF